MERKSRLTNEELSKKFKNQFELVNFAIKLAENMILSGREARVETDAQNRAVQILAEINSGKDQMEELNGSYPSDTDRSSIFILRESNAVIEPFDEQRKKRKNFSDDNSKSGSKRNRK